MLRILSVVLLLNLSACSSDTFYEDAGGIIGAAAGIFLGSQVDNDVGRRVAVFAGAGLGLLLGRGIGRTLDESAREKATEAQNEALEHPEAGERRWTDPDSEASGTVTAKRSEPPEGESGECRTFSHEIEVKGEKDVIYGVACRQDDGKWKTVET